MLNSTPEYSYYGLDDPAQLREHLEYHLTGNLPDPTVRQMSVARFPEG
jgi:hypothetical protein